VIVAAPSDEPEFALGTGDQSGSPVSGDRRRRRLPVVTGRVRIWRLDGPVSRKTVGWQVAGSMTAELVAETFEKTIHCERLRARLIVCSDRGGQDVEAEFRRLPGQHGFEQSMSRAD
jgi:transposase InsO family protein